MSVAIILRLFGQTVTNLAVQCNFALMEQILYATMDQQEITQRGHISKEPRAVIAQKMTSVSTVSALTHDETRSHVTTLSIIQTGLYTCVTDTHLSFSLLSRFSYYCLL